MLSFFITFICTSGFSAWIAKKIIEHLLQVRITRIKSDLDKNNIIELEKIKTKLLKDQTIEIDHIKSQIQIEQSEKIATIQTKLSIEQNSKIENIKAKLILTSNVLTFEIDTLKQVWTLLYDLQQSYELLDQDNEDTIRDFELKIENAEIFINKNNPFIPKKIIIYFNALTNIVMPLTFDEETHSKFLTTRDLIAQEIRNFLNFNCEVEK